MRADTEACRAIAENFVDAIGDQRLDDARRPVAELDVF